MSIFYRQYKNMDTTELCKVWNQSGYAKFWGDEFDKDKFNNYVTENAYFDSRDLIVAVNPANFSDPNGLRDGEVVGFIHGGYPPDKERMSPNRSEGYIAMLVVKEGAWQEEVRAQLLVEMEKHFASNGIHRVHVGAVYPNAPFYTGLLYGCELNGILENDPYLSTFLPQRGYISVERFHRMRLPINADPPVLSFPQRALLSSIIFVKPSEEKMFPSLRQSVDWWEINSHAQMELKYYSLIQKQTKKLIARVGMRTLSRDTGTVLNGLHHLFVTEEFRQRGYAKILMNRVLNDLRTHQESSQVELLVSEKNIKMVDLFARMNFSIVSTGNVYRRDLPADFLQKCKENC